MPKSIPRAQPTPPPMHHVTGQATASALPTFTRQHSSSASESDGEAPSPQVEVYRGFCAAEGDSVAQWSLSQHGMTLMHERGLPPDRALVEARKKARAILKDPLMSQHGLHQHGVDSSQRSFPMGPGQPLGKSPFMSVSESRSTARSFARSRAAHSTGPAQPTVVTYRVPRAKLTENPFNPTERELLAPGGLHPRHVVSVDWLTAESSASSSDDES